MPTPSSLDQVKELLANGNTEEAADMLLALAKTSYKAHAHSALLLKNRIEQLQHDMIDGVITTNEERIEWARISRGVVNLVQQIDKGERPLTKEELPKAAPPKQKPVSTISKALLWALPVVLVIGILGIRNFAKDDKPNADTNPPPREVGNDVEFKELQGRLIFFDGRPASNVNVSILPISGEISPRLKKKIEFRTDNNGEFEFEYPASFDETVHVNIFCSKNNELIDEKTDVRFMPQKFREIRIQK